jgi:hypothetical protein
MLDEAKHPSVCATVRPSVHLVDVVYLPDRSCGPRSDSAHHPVFRDLQPHASKQVRRRLAVTQTCEWPVACVLKRQCPEAGMTGEGTNAVVVILCLDIYPGFFIDIDIAVAPRYSVRFVLCDSPHVGSFVDGSERQA